MKAAVFFSCLVLGMGEHACADGLLQAAIADQQLVFLNKLVAAEHPQSTNQLQKISLGSVMEARQEGYSNQEIFERAKMTGDPRLPQLQEIGYRLHENVLDYLSPMNSLAAKTAPTPESFEDLQKRMEVEDAIKAPKKQAGVVDDKKEMTRIYNAAIQLQQRAEMKVLNEMQ